MADEDSVKLSPAASVKVEEDGVVDESESRSPKRCKRSDDTVVVKTEPLDESEEERCDEIKITVEVKSIKDNREIEILKDATVQEALSNNKEEEDLHTWRPPPPNQPPIPYPAAGKISHLMEKIHFSIEYLATLERAAEAERLAREEVERKMVATREAARLDEERLTTIYRLVEEERTLLQVTEAHLEQALRLRDVLQDRLQRALREPEPQQPEQQQHRPLRGPPPADSACP